ncbi:MAG: hypothetical protein U0893_11880 [Chloroflexota bacterium]
MKRVPADEFAEHAAEYLSGPEAISIEKDGEIIGRYVPTPNGHGLNGHGAADLAARDMNAPDEKRRRKATARAASARLSVLLQEIYAETGMTEEDLAAYFDMTKSMPPGRDLTS